MRLDANSMALPVALAMSHQIITDHDRVTYNGLHSTSMWADSPR